MVRVHKLCNQFVLLCNLFSCAKFHYCAPITNMHLKPMAIVIAVLFTKVKTKWLPVLYYSQEYNNYYGECLMPVQIAST